jgi:hypothetical protein
VAVPALEEPELDEDEEDDEALFERPGISEVMSSTMLPPSSPPSRSPPSSPERFARLVDEAEGVFEPVEPLESVEPEVLDAVAAWAVVGWWSFQYMRPPRPSAATALRTAAMRRANQARGRRGPLPAVGVWGAAIACSLSERLVRTAHLTVRTASQRGVRGG